MSTYCSVHLLICLQPLSWCFPPMCCPILRPGNSPSAWGVVLGRYSVIQVKSRTHDADFTPRYPGLFWSFTFTLALIRVTSCLMKQSSPRKITPLCDSPMWLIPKLCPRLCNLHFRRLSLSVSSNVIEVWFLFFYFLNIQTVLIVYETPWTWQCTSYPGHGIIFFNFFNFMDCCSYSDLQSAPKTELSHFIWSSVYEQRAFFSITKKLESLACCDMRVMACLQFAWVIDKIAPPQKNSLTLPTLHWCQHRSPAALARLASINMMDALLSQ